MAYFDEGALFFDRAAAGRALAEQLEELAERDLLVLGIARGGVAVAAELAARLHAELDVIIARKIGAPNQPDLAVGAITADDTMHLNTDVIDYLALSEDWITRAAAKERLVAAEREAKLRRDAPAIDPFGRQVVVTDDGLATGATMHAALLSTRAKNPRQLIAALPLASQNGCASLAGLADLVICLHTPVSFWAVGLYYERFATITDSAVASLLVRSRRSAAAWQRTRQPTP